MNYCTWWPQNILLTFTTCNQLYTTFTNFYLFLPPSTNFYLVYYFHTTFINFDTTFTSYHIPPTFITFHQFLRTFILLLPTLYHLPPDFTSSHELFSPTFTKILSAQSIFMLRMLLLKIVVDKIYHHLQ